MTDESVEIHSSNFVGFNSVGQRNTAKANKITIRDGAIDTGGTDHITELRTLMAALITELSATSTADPTTAVAHDQAQQLAEELADPEPKQVTKLWSRLRGSLDSLKVAVDVAKIAEGITHLFG